MGDALAGEAAPTHSEEEIQAWRTEQIDARQAEVSNTLLRLGKVRDGRLMLRARTSSRVSLTATTTTCGSCSISTAS